MFSKQRVPQKKDFWGTSNIADVTVRVASISQAICSITAFASDRKHRMGEPDH